MHSIVCSFQLRNFFPDDINADIPDLFGGENFDVSTRPPEDGVFLLEQRQDRRAAGRSEVSDAGIVSEIKPGTGEKLGQAAKRRTPHPIPAVRKTKRTESGGHAFLGFARDQQSLCSSSGQSAHNLQKPFQRPAFVFSAASGMNDDRSGRLGHPSGPVSPAGFQPAIRFARFFTGERTAGGPSRFFQIMRVQRPGGRTPRGADDSDVPRAVSCQGARQSGPRSPVHPAPDFIEPGQPRIEPGGALFAISEQTGQHRRIGRNDMLRQTALSEKEAVSFPARKSEFRIGAGVAEQSQRGESGQEIAQSSQPNSKNFSGNRSRRRYRLSPLPFCASRLSMWCLIVLPSTR